MSQLLLLVACWHFVAAVTGVSVNTDIQQTKETVNAAYALARLEKYGCDPMQTLVLCERDWGAKQVRELNAGFQAGVADSQRE